MAGRVLTGNRHVRDIHNLVLHAMFEGLVWGVPPTGLDHAWLDARIQNCFAEQLEAEHSKFLQEHNVCPLCETHYSKDSAENIAAQPPMPLSCPLPGQELASPSGAHRASSVATFKKRKGDLQ
jgi:hypothetical protein